MSRAIKFTLLSASILFSIACNFATNLLNQASGSNAVKYSAHAASYGYRILPRVGDNISL